MPLLPMSVEEQGTSKMAKTDSEPLCLQLPLPRPPSSPHDMT